MIEIDGKIISLDLFTEYFRCDISRCKGECCVQGNSGAPLEDEEADRLEKEFPAYRDYLKPEGLNAILQRGFAVTDSDGDLTTTLVADAECAYSIVENGITMCAIEKAWKEGRTDFRKPVSCHLYPIRVSKFSNGTYGLNYHRWNVCQPAVICGRDNNTPVYKALKEPLIRYFGHEFFEALAEAEKFIKEGMRE